MSSFVRLAGVVALIVSLGLAVQALVYVPDVKIPVPCGKDLVSKALIELVVGGSLEQKIRALLILNSVAELKVAIAVIVALFKECGDELLKIGAGVAIDVDAHASIVACVSAVITLLVKICLQLSVKFGVAAVVAIFADIDVVLRVCLVNLEVCVVGIVALIVQACVYITASVLAQVKFVSCAEVLVKAGLAA
ncbi:hypothetical protein RhiTH_011022 [Rhizoctonia solani]|uniref:Transmembrane protein n=1 Tax=Rhizoctonia solani TaxID=456999 RepID=A0A8H7HCU5_9AGAM|nr:hypothetical protein RHS04_02022 [Rhizoctonia solani]